MTRGKLAFIVVALLLVAAFIAVGVMIDKQKSAANPGAADNPAATTQDALASTQPGADSAQFYIGGQSVKAGLVPLSDPPQTLSQAVATASAGHPATDRAAVVVQLLRNVDGAPKTTTHSLQDLAAGKSDEKLQAGDVITVIKKIDPTTMPAGAIAIPETTKTLNH